MWLLLLAAPILLWGRCGKPNSHPASSVLDTIISRLTQSIHLCFRLYLLPGCGVSSVCIQTLSFSPVSCPNHLILELLHLSVMFSTFSLSLMSSFLTWCLSVWLHAHLHIFISVTSSFFTRKTLLIFYVMSILGRYDQITRVFFSSENGSNFCLKLAYPCIGVVMLLPPPWPSG